MTERLDVSRSSAESPRHRRWLTAWFLLVPLISPSATAGQTTSRSAQPVKEVVVTAKRLVDVQDQGVATTAMTGDALNAAGVKGPRDIVKIAPSFQIEDPGNGANVLINIRGVGERSLDPHQESPTSVFVDGAYVSFGFAISQPLIDVDHIEVLNGPQGTLFGRDDTGGVLNIVNKEPTRQFEGYAQTTLGSYDEYGLEGAVSGPLGPDVSARLSGYLRRSGNYVRNAGAGGDTGANETEFVRGQLLFGTTDRFNLLISGRYWEAGPEPGVAFSFRASAPNPSNPAQPSPPASLADFQAYCAQPIPGLPIPYGSPTTLRGNCFGPSPGPYRGDFGDRTLYRARLSGVTATANLKLNEALVLTSVTDYFHLNSAFDIDADGTPLKLLNGDAVLDGDQFSQELRLAGNYARTRWFVGFYYLKIDAASRNYNDLTAHPLVLSKFTDSYKTPTRSWAAFAHFDYDLTPTFTLVGGLRYDNDRKSIDSVTTCIPALSGGPFPGFPFTSTCDPTFPTFAGTVRALPGFTAKLDDDNWAGKAEVDWRPVANVLVYAEVVRGAKAGGVNSAGGYPAQFIVYQPDALTDYEAGVKSVLFDPSTTLNAAVFHYDYHNFQTLTADAHGATYVFNIEARNTGVEATISSQPLKGLSVDLGLSYLNAIELHVPVPGGFADQSMPYAPQWRLVSSARYEFGWVGGKAAVQADWQHTSHRSTQAVDYAFVRIPDEDVVNAQISWTTADDRVTIAARVDNLSGRPIVADRGDLTGLLGGVATIYGPPRWFRGIVTYNF